MKKRKIMIGGGFKSTIHQQVSGTRIIEMESEDLAANIHRAVKDVLQIINTMQLGPGAVLFLLAQQKQVLFTGDSHLTIESGISIANNVLVLWQDRYYKPEPAYPYLLEETLQEIQQGPKANTDYAESFRPFTLENGDAPHELGTAQGIVRHPETKIWQVWIMADGGPYTFLAAYHVVRFF
jgi:hypothetical protein